MCKTSWIKRIVHMINLHDLSPCALSNLATLPHCGVCVCSWDGWAKNNGSVYQPYVFPAGSPGGEGHPNCLAKASRSLYRPAVIIEDVGGWWSLWWQPQRRHFMLCRRRQKDSPFLFLREMRNIFICAFELKYTPLLFIPISSARSKSCKPVSSH